MITPHENREYSTRRLRSCKKVVWNKIIKIITINCNLNKTRASKRLAKHISNHCMLSSDIFRSICFWLYDFAGRASTGSRKGHVVTSQIAQQVREINSFFRKRQIKTVFLILWRNTLKAAWVKQEQCHGRCVPEYALQKHFPMCNVMAEILLILFTSRRCHIYKTVLIAK